MNLRIFFSLLIGLFALLLNNNQLLVAQTNLNAKLRLQLGAYRNPSLGKFDRVKLNELKGAIYTEDIGNGVKRVFIGDYATPQEAEKALEKVKTMGYENAYIVAIEEKDKAVKMDNVHANTSPKPIEQISDQRTRGGATMPPSGGTSSASSSTTTATNPPASNGTTNPSTPKNEPKAPEKGNYIIQLGSFGQVNFKSFGNVADLGELTAERVGDATKMTLGTYTSRKDAEQILTIVKQRGYNAAFIKVVPIAEK